MIKCYALVKRKKEQLNNNNQLSIQQKENEKTRLKNVLIKFIFEKACRYNYKKLITYMLPCYFIYSISHVVDVAKQEKQLLMILQKLAPLPEFDQMVNIKDYYELLFGLLKNLFSK